MKKLINIIIITAAICLCLSTNIFADQFSALGPISPGKVNVINIVDNYNKGILSNEIWNSNWQFADGKIISWQKCKYNQQFMSIEDGNLCDAKAGDFFIFKTTVINSKKQTVRYIYNRQNIRYIFLNGKIVYGDAAEMPEGTNEIVLVYVKKTFDKKTIPFRVINAFTGKEFGLKFNSIVPSKNKKIKIPKITDGKLKFIVKEKSNGKIKPCRLYVYNENRQPQYDYHWPSCFETFTCNGEAELNLLPGNYTFQVESGKEFMPVKGKVNIKQGKTVSRKIQLVKIADMNKESWYAGDMHNHTIFDYTPLYIKSENINIAYVPSWWINPPMGRTSKKELLDKKPLIEIDDNHFLYTRTGEDERNDCTLMFFNMPDDVEIPEATWTFPPNVYFAKKFGEISNVNPNPATNRKPSITRLGRRSRVITRRAFYNEGSGGLRIASAAKSTNSILNSISVQGNVSDKTANSNRFLNSSDLVAGFGVWVHLDHMYWWQTPQILACGELDSIEVINNNFVHGGMNKTEAWGKPRDKNKYPDPYGNAEYQQDVYFKILNCGLRIPPGAGAAAPVGGGPFGYNRVYVKVDGKLTWEKWWKNLKAGKCFITCGPLLRVTANGELPGYIFKAKKNIVIKPEIKLDSIDNITKIQIIKNGKIEKSVPYAEWLKTNDIGSITFDKSGWFLIRALTDNPGTYRFAMTAPFYVEIGDTPVLIKKSAVEFFLNWAKEAAKRNPETEPEKKALVDKYSKETLNFWEDLLRKSK